MAKPIKETPFLKGKDAVKFNQDIKDNRGAKVSTEVRARMKSNYEKLKSIATF